MKKKSLKKYRTLAKKYEKLCIFDYYFPNFSDMTDRAVFVQFLNGGPSAGARPP